MYLSNPIQNLAAALYSAVYKDMPEVIEQKLDYSQGYEKARDLPKIEVRRRPYETEIEVYAMFEQSWGSTALGFGGIGGQAISSAYTIVLWNGLEDFTVYFGGRGAYRVNRPNKSFYEDIQRRSMADVRSSSKYAKEDK